MVGVARYAAQLAQGVAQDRANPEGCGERMIGEQERGPAGSLMVGRLLEGNRVARVSVRSAMEPPGPERTGSAAAPLPFSSYAAGGYERESLLFAPAAMSRDAKQWSRSASETCWVRGTGEAVLLLDVTSFLAGMSREMGRRVVSVCYLLVCQDAPWAGFRLERECQPLQPPQQWWETKRRQAPRLRCPTEGGISSNHRTGVHRARDQRQTPTVGLDRGRRT